MTYEYVCEACGHQWEAQQSIKDSPLKKCVSCGVDRAKRLVSGGTGFLLKGGGWYADLYGSPGSGAGKSDDKSSKATPSTKPESSKAESGASSGGDKPAASAAASSTASASTSTSTSSSSSAAS